MICIRQNLKDLKEDKEKSDEEIQKAFDTPVPMRVFSWDGEIDTVMTPMDSIKYYKYFLQGGLLSMEPTTGMVKAYVGGIDYRHFKYDPQNEPIGKTGRALCFPD